jgi:hypothetical protein
MEPVMTKRNWFGYGLYCYSILAICGICFHLISTGIDIFRSISYADCKFGTAEAIDNFIYRIPAFFVFPALALWGARRQLRPQYVSTGFLSFGFIVWSLAWLSFWGWGFVASLRSGYW